MKEVSKLEKNITTINYNQLYKNEKKKIKNAENNLEQKKQRNR